MVSFMILMQFNHFQKLLCSCHTHSVQPGAESTLGKDIVYLAINIEVSAGNEMH